MHRKIGAPVVAIALFTGTKVAACGNDHFPQLLSRLLGRRIGRRSTEVRGVQAIVRVGEAAVAFDLRIQIVELQLPKLTAHARAVHYNHRHVHPSYAGPVSSSADARSDGFAWSPQHRDGYDGGRYWWGGDCWPTEPCGCDW